MDWTLERDDALRARIGTGQSYSVVADELTTMFGDRISRNAVIGRAARIGIAGAHRKAEPAAPRRKRRHYFGVDFRKPIRPTGNRGLAAPPERVEPPAPPRRRGPFDMPLAQRCSLMELTATTCRFPVGEPEAADFFFCGGAPVEGRPYCPHHCRIAYRRPGEGAAV